MLRFLATKLGLSIILAVVIIGGATALKFKTPAQDNSIGSKVGLIAAASVENAIKSGELESNWENTLKNLRLGTTTDDIVANLGEIATDAGASTKPLTATDRFAQEFFVKYIELEESGGIVDENTGLRLVNELLARDYGGPTEEKTYTTNDIKIINTTSLTELKKYGNNLGATFDKPIPKDYENELVVINRVYENENYEELEKLTQNIARYEDIRTQMALIAVPSVFRNVHVAMLNSLSAIIEGVRGMTLMATDPVGATKMVLRYEEGIRALDLSAGEISSYFKRQNIVFSSTEPGFVFVE